MPNTVKLLKKHKEDCLNYTGQTIELGTIVCIVNGDTEECNKHDVAGNETIEIRCEGCNTILFSRHTT